jgi:hypothetical protein
MTAPDQVEWLTIAHDLIAECEAAAGTQLLTSDQAVIIAERVARELAAAFERGQAAASDRLSR